MTNLQPSKKPDARLRYKGRNTYRGQDERLSISLTCVAGDVVKVSGEKADELLKLAPQDWEPYDPAAPAEVPPGDQAGGSAASSSAGDGDPNAPGGAMHTGAAGQKSDGDAAGAGGQGAGGAGGQAVTTPAAKGAKK